MTDPATEHATWQLPKLQRKHTTDYVELLVGHMYHLTQDEVIVDYPRCSIRGILTLRGDTQSDKIDTPIMLPTEDVVTEVLRHFREQINRAWESGESSTDKLVESVPVKELTHSQDIDTPSDDVSQWTPAQLASEILQAKAESDMPRLQQMILTAEDTGFTADQSNRLAPWFLSFAERHRDSSDPQDEAAVWSAIRTGASMLTPDAADGLRPLLEPGHSIETSLVTLKMLGRIFEAQPPTDADQHPGLAGEVCQIAESLLNRYAITVSQSAAMAHLAIYALAAMASSETQRMVETAQELGAAWFTRRLTRKLCELREAWRSHRASTADEPRELLDTALRLLQQD